MLEAIGFLNFKALRSTTLPLGRFSLIVGPNGSGKSTALHALDLLGNPRAGEFHKLLTVGTPVAPETTVEINLTWAEPHTGVRTNFRWTPDGSVSRTWPDASLSEPAKDALKNQLGKIRVYHLSPAAVQAPVTLKPHLELGSDGSFLAGVLDRLRDNHPERWEALLKEIHSLLPEFDHILFDTPGDGQRAFALRTSKRQHKINAPDVSQGTALALAILTLAHLPDPPPLVGLEEPDRGIHPRLLRDISDALYRLAYPENYGEKREPVQVVATTHSPYFLDLFKDHPEEIVIAEKAGLEARFQRLVERPDIDEILGDAPLGEVWYSGVLGGVPAKP